jgi:hypothetical protein
MALSAPMLARLAEPNVPERWLRSELPREREWRDVTEERADLISERGGVGVFRGMDVPRSVVEANSNRESAWPVSGIEP